MGLRTYLSSSWALGVEGLEAVWEYNGLSLNDRSNMEQYRLTDIDGLADADIRDSRAPITEAHGELAYNMYQGGRTITLSGRIRAGNVTMLRQMQEDLKEAFSSTVELPLYIRGLKADDVYINCRKSAPIAMREVQANQWVERDFMLTLRASNPRFLSASLSTARITAVGGGTSISITNRGNFPAEPTFYLGRAVGGINAPVIRNTTLGLTASISGSSTFASSGKFYKIVGDAAQRIFRDDLSADKWSLWVAGNKMPVLNPGVNNIALSQATVAGTVYLDVEWRDSWI